MKTLQCVRQHAAAKLTAACDACWQSHGLPSYRQVHAPTGASTLSQRPLTYLRTFTASARRPVVCAAAAPDAVDVQTAEKMLEQGWRYLDVRTEHEFAAGHPPGAVNVPVMFTTTEGLTVNQQFLDDVKGHFKPDDQILVGCKMGKRSEMAIGLMGRDFKYLANVAGGFDDWSASGKAVET
jgi:rhodanese-related sulfurtransferase